MRCNKGCSGSPRCSGLHGPQPRGRDALGWDLRIPFPQTFSLPDPLGRASCPAIFSSGNRLPSMFTAPLRVVAVRQSVTAVLRRPCLPVKRRCKALARFCSATCSTAARAGPRPARGARAWHALEAVGRNTGAEARIAAGTLDPPSERVTVTRKGVAARVDSGGIAGGSPRRGEGSASSRIGPARGRFNRRSRARTALRPPGSSAAP
jgi:hypothetical protein